MVVGTYKDIIAYVQATGVPHRVTSTIRPAGTQTAAGNTSCHAADNARCDAIDLAGPGYGRDTAELAAIFWAFEPVFDQMHELIYAGPQTTFNIKAGKKVAKYAQSGHHDHVHASILATTTLRMPQPKPTPEPPKPTPISMEDDMPTVTAQDMVINPTKPAQGYVLDAHGGIHPIGGAPAVTGGPYWKPESGRAPARRLVITDWAKPAGYVLDCLGGKHAFGGAPKLEGGPYWKNGFIPPTVQM